MHFAHKPDAACGHGQGETIWHRTGKMFADRWLRAAGWTVEAEKDLGGERRADVFASLHGNTTIYEFQQAELGEDILGRTQDLLKYAQNVVWVLPWVPEKHLHQDRKTGKKEYKWRMTDRFTMQAYLNYGSLNPKVRVYFWDVNKFELHDCYRKGWYVWIPHKTWYETGGVERSAGGYWKRRPRWCELVIKNTYRIDDTSDFGDYSQFDLIDLNKHTTRYKTM